MKIIQVTPTLSYGDAIGNHAIALHHLFEEKGYSSEIYAEFISKDVDRNIVQSIDDWKEPEKDDILIYHLAIGWQYIHLVLNANCRKICIYHNVTPASFFENYSDAMYIHCLDGMSSVRELAHAFDYVICDSEYNKQSLVEMGYDCKIDTVPILVPFEDYKQEPSEEIIQQYQGKKGNNILFTGRVVPNKKTEDVIHAFSLYKKYYDNDARLFIVGRYRDNPTYFKHLSEYIRENDFKDIIFTGHITFAEVLAYYQIADLFVCMSEHEGFCVPLIEAMYFDIPIIAYDATAVKYTLGDSGVLVKEKNFSEIASMMNRILSQEEVKEEILEGQRKRLENFSTEKVQKELMECLERFINITGEDL